MLGLPSLCVSTEYTSTIIFLQSSIHGCPNLEKVLRNSVNKSVNWVEPRSATVLYLTLALPECIMVAAPASAYPRSERPVNDQ